MFASIAFPLLEQRFRARRTLRALGTDHHVGSLYLFKIQKQNRCSFKSSLAYISHECRLQYCCRVRAVSFSGSSSAEA